jgi:hypothetical protein
VPLAKELWLDKNLLSNSITSEIRLISPPAYISLPMDYNHLEGSIPSEIGQLVGLDLL